MVVNELEAEMVEFDLLGICLLNVAPRAVSIDLEERFEGLSQSGCLAQSFFAVQYISGA